MAWACLKPCQPPFFLECAIFQLTSFILLFIYSDSFLYNTSKETLTAIQRERLISPSPTIQVLDTTNTKNITNIKWFGSIKSIIPEMSTRNSRGILYAEWYTDQGNGSLSENEQMLPTEYRQCIMHINYNNSSCKLPNGFSFNALKWLGQGKSGIVHLIEIFNDKNPDYKEKYVLKYSDKWHRCRNNHLEWRLLNLIYEQDLNMPHVHPLIPFYWFNTSCMVFMSAIDNSWLLNNLYLLYQKPKIFREQYPLITKESYIQSFNEIDGGLLDFFIKCYKNIIKVLEKVFYSLHVIYNDLHPQNIIVNNLTHECYLIDFGSLFQRQIVMGNQRGKDMFNHKLKYKCERISCAPRSHYYLKFRRVRHDFRWNHATITDIQVADILMQHAMDGLKYNLFSKLLHIFINYYADTILRFKDKEIGDKLFKMNREISTYCINPSKRNLESAWCRRFEIIEILKTNTDNLYNSTKNQSVKEEFWQLMDLYEQDKESVNCSNVNKEVRCD